jgi:hypothetical protein
MAKFTDKFIDALKPKAVRYEVWEGRGFGMRVSPHGVKTWVWMYHFDGRPRRMTLGTYPELPLAEAHVKLADARKLLTKGVDPGAKAVADHKAERIAETVSELAEAYLEKWARPRKRSADEDERQLRKDVIPAWGRRKAKDITRRDVLALLDNIVDRGSPIAADRTLAVIRRMFGWALSRDIIPASPCVAVKAPAREPPRPRAERGRDRQLLARPRRSRSADFFAIDPTGAEVSARHRAAQGRGHRCPVGRIRPPRRRLDDPGREGKERDAPSRAAVAACPRRAR